MLTHPTLDQLRALKLDGMAQAFVELEAQEEARNLTHAEWLALLLDREVGNRNTRRFQIRLRAARLRHSQAAIEDVDYRTPRRLDKALFQQLATCRWITERRGLLITGPCGVGKSWLSCALAQKACRDGYTVHYARVPRLFTDLDLAHGDGRFARLFRMLVRVDLLVLDDWGPDRLSTSQRRDLMEIVEDRHGRGSLLITSQGWKRWSSQWLYENLKLFNSYRVRRPPAKVAPSKIGPISLGAKRTGKRSAGNPHATFDVAGIGNADGRDDVTLADERARQR